MIMLLLLTVTCIKFWAISSLIGWDDDDGGEDDDANKDDGDDVDDDNEDDGDMYEHFGQYLPPQLAGRASCPQGVS